MVKSSINIGDVYNHPKYGKYVITDKINSDNVTLVFEKTGFQLITTSCKIRVNSIRDHKQQIVFGVGKSFSDKYSIRVNGKKAPQYAAWENMLSRCYYKKNPRYSAYGGVGVVVSDDWLTYENFAMWFDANYIDGYHLDKDLLGNGKIYSAETCCYIPQKLNGQFVVNSKNTGRKQNHLTTGVYQQGNGFTSSVNGDIIVKRHFVTMEEAQLDYVKRKWNVVRNLAEQMYRWTEITEKVFDAVVKICDDKQKGLFL